MTNPPDSIDQLDEVDDALAEMKKIAGEFEAEHDTGRFMSRPPASRELRLGATGPDVAILQAELNRHGASPVLVLNGEFDKVTLDAVRWFQAQRKLTTDGEVETTTWAALTGSAEDNNLHRRGLTKGPYR